MIFYHVHVGPESQKMEEMTKEEMVTMARNAFTLAAEIFNFFHSAVKKTSKPKMVVVQEQASGNESAQATKTNKSKGKTNKPITKDAEKKTPSTKDAKKERRKKLVQERDGVQTLHTADAGQEKAKGPLVHDFVTSDLTNLLSGMSISATSKTTKKKKGKK